MKVFKLNRGEQTVRLRDLVGLGIHIFPCSKRARFRHSELLRHAAELFGSYPKMFLRHRSTARFEFTPFLLVGNMKAWMELGMGRATSGMFWTVRGADSIIALRCSRFNGRFEEYWETRRAA